MSVLVTDRFLLEILFQGLGQIHTGLVGQADQYPKHIRYLIAVVIVTFLFD